MKEYWIQIETGARDIRSQHIDAAPPQMIGKSTRVRPVNVVPGASDIKQSGNRNVAIPDSQGRGQEEWHAVDPLVLRRFKPPQQADGKDAWTVPDEPEKNSRNCSGVTPANHGLLSIDLGSTDELRLGDWIFVHFRNADQRKRIVTRMVAIDLPFGGSVTIPTPFHESLPTEYRTHRLHPHGIDCSLGGSIAPPSSLDRKQPVGSEAGLWNLVGVTEFKIGDRVPPGATFTYRWNTLNWPKSSVSPSLQVVRFVIEKLSSPERSNRR